MKPGWIAVFALPVFCTPLSHPQVSSPKVIPATLTSTDAKTAARPEGGAAPDADIPAASAAGSSSEAQAAATLSTVNRSAPALTEEELRQRLVGKQMFLRGLWLDDELHFDLHGKLASQSAKGSFTLCAVEIEHVRVTKRRVELEGVRYGIHFEDEANWANQASSFDRIRVTPKKKHLEIVLDRQVVVVPKKKKGEKGKADEQPGTPGTAAAASDAEVGAETTTFPGESAERVRRALDTIFAPSLDAGMIAQMPEYWRYFYQAQMDHKSIEPTDPHVYRPGPGVEGPALIKNVAPLSNDYAQRSEVAGVASYKVILGPDGKPLAVAVYRPIGFGLDENAVAAIKKSTFTPAVKDGQPVMSVFELAVNFRIYSKRTAQAAPEPETPEGGVGVAAMTGKPSLPGLFTANEGR